MANGSAKCTKLEQFSLTAASIVSAGTGVGTYDPESGIVTLYMAMQASSTFNTSATMFTVPSKYRPSATKNIPMLAFTGSDAPVVSYVKVYSDGTCKQSATATAQRVFAVGSYQI